MQLQEVRIGECQRHKSRTQQQSLNAVAIYAVAGIAAAASCLHAAPALADTAVQGAEQIAKQLSGKGGAISESNLVRPLLSIGCSCAAQQCCLTAGSFGNEPFREGLVSGFLLILFSELGDKTFFIAVLLALKKNKGLVFAGTFGALAVMTVISVRPQQNAHTVRLV